MVNWLSLAVPVAYLGILLGSLATFSSIYRSRKAARANSLAPWFKEHLSRDIYLTLLHLEQKHPETGKSVTVPDSIIKTALLRRAMEDIDRIMQIRSQKPALQALVQKGSVGDDLWQRFQRAEKELEEELKDVVNEANALSPGWGALIFQSANEMKQNERLRDRLNEIEAKKPAEREAWEKKRAEARKDLLGEEPEDEKKALESSHGKTEPEFNDPVAEPEADTTEPQTQTQSPSKSEGGSDEDAVLVDGDVPSTPATPSHPEGGSKKKKKGKK